MKKIILSLFIGILAVSACKKKSNQPIIDPNPIEPPIEIPPTAEANTLVQKASITANGETKTYTFTYQSNSKKLDKIISSNGHTEQYEYSGNLITKISFGNNGDYKKFEYQNENLIRETQYRNNLPVNKSEYTNESGSKIIIKQYEYQQNQWVLEGNSITAEFDNKGNFYKGSTAGLQANIEFDNKNTPLLNIVGWSKINLLGGIIMGDNIGIEDILGRRNNPTKVSLNQTGQATVQTINTFLFEDNNNSNFPTKITGVKNGSTTYIAEFCYSGECTNINNSGSNNGNQQVNAEQETLPATFTMTYAGNTITSTIHYLNNSKKIEKITRSNDKNDLFEYNENWIEKTYQNSKTSGHYDVFTYQSNKLATKTSIRNNVNTEKINFTYPSNNITKLSFFEYDNGAWKADDEIDFTFDAKGNIINGTQGTNLQISSTFDDKNSPVLNIVGWNKVNITGGIPLGNNIDFMDVVANFNNPIKLTVNANNTTEEIVYIYEFNDTKNPKFPTKISTTKNGVQFFSLNITYQ